MPSGSCLVETRAIVLFTTAQTCQKSECIHFRLYTGGNSGTTDLTARGWSNSVGLYYWYQRLKENRTKKRKSDDHGNRNSAYEADVLGQNFPIEASASQPS